MKWISLNRKLIGQRFRRNKYGLSGWTMTIKDVYVDFDSLGKITEVYVRAEESDIPYYLDEIVIINN